VTVERIVTAPDRGGSLTVIDFPLIMIEIVGGKFDAGALVALALLLASVSAAPAAALSAAISDAVRFMTAPLCRRGVG
jgi:hypothetical protein